MKTGTRLALFALAAVATFGGSYVIAGVVVPDHIVNEWVTDSVASPHPVDSPTHSE